MINGVNHKEAFRLFWAIQWRWILIYIVLAIPLFTLRAIPHSSGIEALYELIDLVLVFVSFYICVVLLLKKGYGSFQIKITNQEKECLGSE